MSTIPQMIWPRKIAKIPDTTRTTAMIHRMRSTTALLRVVGRMVCTFCPHRAGLTIRVAVVRTVLFVTNAFLRRVEPRS